MTGKERAPRAISHQPQALQAGVAVLADDDVVVNRNAERIGDADDRLGHLDVGGGRRRITARVIVHQPVKLRKLLYFNRIFSGTDELAPVSGVCNSRQFGTIPV